jgi:hypothetical protein
VRYYFYAWLIFMSGFVAALNLSGLVSTNPEWVAEWWKFGLACALGFMFAVAARLRVQP